MNIIERNEHNNEDGLLNKEVQRTARIIIKGDTINKEANMETYSKDKSCVVMPNKTFIGLQNRA